MLILDTESTCKWYCNKKSNSHSGCKNKQQADFEVKLGFSVHFSGFCVNESTCKSNSHSECKNEQQADFEVPLENKITMNYH